MKARLLDLCAPVGIDLGGALGRNVRLEAVEIVAERPVPAGDRDAVSAA